jgi:hypothetical protein
MVSLNKALAVADRQTRDRRGSGGYLRQRRHVGETRVYEIAE